ncbi:MAG: hypothetical protein AAGA55_08460 [Planctomycetota bacterium]
MNTNPTPSDRPEPELHAALSERIGRLERSNNRWRMLAACGIAATAGLLIGGLGSQPGGSRTLSPGDYTYMSTDDTIYRMDPSGRFEYIKFENGRRSTNGYFDWGPVRVDAGYSNPSRPQP